MRIMVVVVIGVAVLGCGGGGGGEGDTSDGKGPPNWFDGLRTGDARGQDGTGTPDVATGDASGSDGSAGPDAVHGDGTAPDLAPTNTPPKAEALSPVSLKMGTSTTMDLKPFIADEQDVDEALVLSWSADHVALKDALDHVVTIVAPTDWFGAEVVDIIVTDTGGLEAATSIKVVVEEVTIPDPPDDCGKVEFSFDGGMTAKEVLVAGTFTDPTWGDGALPMSDDDGDGIWTLTITLDPGTYQYKFVVDGTWTVDPKNPNRVDDGQGGLNSVLVVPACPPPT